MELIASARGQVDYDTGQVKLANGEVMSQKEAQRKVRCCGGW